jgi:hypothetical protein
MSKLTDYKAVRFAVVWRSRNTLDGYHEHFVTTSRACVDLYRTRKEAREAAEATFGYIRDRPDLKAEPHGWMMPVVRRVIVTVKIVTVKEERRAD